MIAKYDGPLNKHIDFTHAGPDGEPASGLSVQTYIKQIDASKISVGYEDENNARYLLFADEEDLGLYLEDPTRVELIKANIPLNYSGGGGGGGTGDINIVDDPSIKKLIVTIGDSQYLVDREERTAPATPTMTASGTYVTSVTVNMTCSSAGSIIYYTYAEGSMPPDPTTSSNRGTSLPLNQIITNAETTYYVKCIAVKDGLSSVVVAGTYVVKSKLPNVVISEITGTEQSESRTANITCALSGVEIWYTLHGEDPKTSGTAIAYDGTIVMSTAGNYQIKAYAKKGTWVDSDVTSSSTFKVRKLAPVTYNVSNTPSSEYRDVTMTSASAPVGTMISYSYSGTNPATQVVSGTVENGGSVRLSIANTSYTFTATASVEDYTTSESSTSPSIVVRKLADVSITVSGSDGSNPRVVTLQHADGNATIHYTTDNSTPTAASPVYTPGQTELIFDTYSSSPYHIKAIAMRESWVTSNVASRDFTVGRLPMYYGYGGATIILSQIVSLPGVKSNGIPQGTYTSTTPYEAYLWVCIDAVESILSIIDAATTQEVDMNSPIIVGGYKCYRSTYTHTTPSLTFTVR